MELNLLEIQNFRHVIHADLDSGRFSIVHHISVRNRGQVMQFSLAPVLTALEKHLVEAETVEVWVPPPPVANGGVAVLDEVPPQVACVVEPHPGKLDMRSPNERAEGRVFGQPDCVGTWEFLPRLGHSSQLVLGPDEKQGKTVEEDMEGIKGIDAPYRSKEVFPHGFEAWSSIRAGVVEEALKVFDGAGEADDGFDPLPGRGFLVRAFWRDGRVAVDEVRCHECQDLQPAVSRHVALDVEPNEDKEPYFGRSEVSRHGHAQAPRLDLVKRKMKFWLSCYVGKEKKKKSPISAEDVIVLYGLCMSRLHKPGNPGTWHQVAKTGRCGVGAALAWLHVRVVSYVVCTYIHMYV